jgi:non-specific protein-tyrosine kinase
MDGIDSRELGLRDYLVVLRRRKAVILTTTALVLLAAIAYSLSQTSVYRSTVEVLLEPRASEQIFSPDAQQRTDQQQTRVKTEIAVMNSRSVRDAVTQALGRSPKVDIVSSGLTNVVTVSAESHDPQEAANVANTYAQTYVTVRRDSTVKDLLDTADQIQQQISKINEQIAAIDKPLADLDNQILGSASAVDRQLLKDRRDRLATQTAAQRQALEGRRSAFADQLDRLQVAGHLTTTGGAQIISTAQPARSPIKPAPKRDAALALVAGLILGVGLAFIREYLDDTVKSKDDLDLASGGLAVLGLIPFVDTWRDHSRPMVISISEPKSPAAESYRALRTAVQFIGIERTVEVIQITSPAAAEGKSTTLANLGVALARAGKRVVLVDCDLRRPRIESFFGVDNKVGITSVIIGDSTLADAVQPVPGESRLMVLPAGSPPPNPSELLSAKRTADIFTALREGCDYVLVDCPPLLPVADSVVLAGLVDATLLVATARSTAKSEIRRAVELLHQVDAPLVGVVLNGIPIEASYGYGYGYSYGDEPKSGRGVRSLWGRLRGDSFPELRISAPVDTAISSVPRPPSRVRGANLSTPCDPPKIQQ